MGHSANNCQAQGCGCRWWDKYCSCASTSTSSGGSSGSAWSSSSCSSSKPGVIIPACGVIISAGRRILLAYCGTYQPGSLGSQYPSRLQPGSNAVLDRLPLPKCSYINTDFPGDDLLFDKDDEPGINSGSARACKARCKQEEACVFWSYREGNSRDTFT